ncbi:MAG: hypothetical protein JWR80_4159 [Bradyrhizobium sp.]|nr:hypothetical protein [Bradyrhizobium sp.]
MDTTPEYSDLLSELNKLELLLIDIELILKRSDNDRRLELIGLRRLMSTQMARVRVLGDSAFPPTNGAKLTTDYRTRFSTAVRAIALHQASWPAIKINEGREGYFESATAVVGKVRDFVTWARDALTELQRKR